MKKKKYSLNSSHKREGVKMFGDFINYVSGTLDRSSVQRDVIANNISNFNTPNYKSKQLVFEKTFQSELQTKLKVSEEKHIQSSGSDSLSLQDYEIVESSQGSVRVDGNNVDQTTEMINMLKNNYIYNTGVNAINKEFDLFKTAIGR